MFFIMLDPLLAHPIYDITDQYFINEWRNIFIRQFGSCRGAANFYSPFCWQLNNMFTSFFERIKPVNLWKYISQFQINIILKYDSLQFPLQKIKFKTIIKMLTSSSSVLKINFLIQHVWIVSWMAGSDYYGLWEKKTFSMSKRGAWVA